MSKLLAERKSGIVLAGTLRGCGIFLTALVIYIIFLNANLAIVLFQVLLMASMS